MNTFVQYTKELAGILIGFLLTLQVKLRRLSIVTICNLNMRHLPLIESLLVVRIEILQLFLDMCPGFLTASVSGGPYLGSPYSPTSGILSGEPLTGSIVFDAEFAQVVPLIVIMRWE